MTVFSGIVGAIAATLAFLMFKGTPPRAPKTASLLALVAGGFLTGMGAGLITFVVGLFDQWVSPAVGGSVAVIVFVVLLYKYANEMTPRLGRIQAGRATASTAVAGLLLPTFAALTGGAIGAFVQQVSATMAQGLSAFVGGGLG